MDKPNIRRARKYTLCPLERQQRIKGNRTIYQLEHTFRKTPKSVISTMNLYKVTHPCNRHPCEDVEHFPYPRNLPCAPHRGDWDVPVTVHLGNPTTVLTSSILGQLCLYFRLL